MAEQILVIEDDNYISELVKLHLEELGYQVTCIADGAKALEKFYQEQYSLLIVDLMLPGLQGTEIIKKVRLSNSQVPILITTAKSDLMHKVVGFEIGADDYLAKPFNILELVARTKALLRRSGAASAELSDQKTLEIGDIKVDQYRHKVLVKGNEIELSPILFNLLVHLMRRPGRPYSRAELLNQVWNYDHEGYEHTVDTHVNRLRGKIEPKPASPTYILTVWGVGYRFVEPLELKRTKE